MDAPIDYIAGDFTFGQRIELGDILADDSRTDLQKFKDVFECIEGKAPSLAKIGLKGAKKYRLEFARIVEGLQHWAKLENERLNEEPTDEEKRAGVAKFSKNVGHLGTVVSLARMYNTDPDDVLKWKYSKVFGLLYVNLEEFRYKKRYQDVIQKSKK